MKCVHVWRFVERFKRKLTSGGIEAAPPCCIFPSSFRIYHRRGISDNFRGGGDEIFRYYIASRATHCSFAKSTRDCHDKVKDDD